MGNTQHKYAHYEDVQQLTNDGLLLNTLDIHKQHCLIQGTLNATDEEHVINQLMQSTHGKRTPIIIYGNNYLDTSVHTKYIQLTNAGFSNCKMYLGGMFEWLLLQEVYGSDLFVTTSATLDLLQYRH